MSNSCVEGESTSAVCTARSRVGAGMKAEWRRITETSIDSLECTTERNAEGRLASGSSYSIFVEFHPLHNSRAIGDLTRCSTSCTSHSRPRLSSLFYM